MAVGDGDGVGVDGDGDGDGLDGDGLVGGVDVDELGPVDEIDADGVGFTSGTMHAAQIEQATTACRRRLVMPATPAIPATSSPDREPAVFYHASLGLAYHEGPSRPACAAGNTNLPIEVSFDQDVPSGGRWAVRTIRVAVVEEHEILRRGIVACLAEDSSILVVEHVERPPLSIDADVVVASTTAIRLASFGCPVVVCGEMTFRGSEPRRRNRVLATLPRASLTPDQLVAAVRAAAAGLEVQGPHANGSSSLLDERRLEVLRLLATGADTHEISESLRYSERTIKVLIQGIEHHLGARNRAQAVALAVRDGLI